MSTIAPTVTRGIVPDESVIQFAWAALGNADDGQPIQPNYANMSDVAVHVTGTFGGATVVWEVSDDGTNWRTAKDPSNTAISVTSTDLRQALETALYKRPRTSGGTGTSINVIATLRRPPVASPR